MMTSRFSLLTCLIPALCLLSVILPNSLQADWVEDAVTDIRGKYNQIEGANMQSNRIAWESDQEPASGTLVKYFSNGSVAKIHFSFAEGDHGGSDEYYYYWNGQLFFSFVTQSYWKFSGQTLANGESGTTDIAVEHRLYFSNGSLIRHLKKEAESANASALSGILAKKDNQNYQDLDLSNAVLSRGTRAPSVSNGSGIENLMFGQ
tara:strand:- start:1207 stop:1821 length:615 start_codon:yes stop_codon:yes gene_type:complete